MSVLQRGAVDLRLVVVPTSANVSMPYTTMKASKPLKNDSYVIC